MKNLIILADCGLDDACAVAYLIGQSEFKSIDVVSIGGNVSEEQSFSNLKRLLGALNIESKEKPKNVRLASTKSIPQRACPLPLVHGSDGMGDLVFTKLAEVNVVDFEAVLDGIIQNPAAYTILSLGPLTVTKYILDRCVLDKPRLVIMAGIVDEKPNYEGVEFNQALDIPAYKHCLKNYDHVIATLDTCRASEFNLAGHRFNSGTVMSRLVTRAIELAESRHKDNSYIYDFIASLYLTKPQIFEAKKTDDRMGSVLNQLKINAKGFHLKNEIE